MARVGTVTVWIQEDNLDGMDMAEALRHVADQIEQGMTSGHYPNWEIKIDEES